MRVNAVAERMEAACHEHNQAIGQALHDRVFRAALQLISCGLPLNFALCALQGLSFSDPRSSRRSSGSCASGRSTRLSCISARRTTRMRILCDGGCARQHAIVIECHSA